MAVRDRLEAGGGNGWWRDPHLASPWEGEGRMECGARTVNRCSPPYPHPHSLPTRGREAKEPRGHGLWHGIVSGVGAGASLPSRGRVSTAYAVPDSSPDRLSSRVESVSAVGVGGEGDAVARGEGLVAVGADGHQPEAVDIDVEEGVGAELLGDRDSPLPEAGAGCGRDGKMFGPHADGLGIVL